MTDNIQKGNVEVEYYPTAEIIAGFMSKPLQGENYKNIVSSFWAIKCRNLL